MTKLFRRLPVNEKLRDYFILESKIRHENTNDRRVKRLKYEKKIKEYLKYRNVIEVIVIEIDRGQKLSVTFHNIQNQRSKYLFYDEKHIVKT